MPRKQSPRNKQSAQSVEESAQAILATTTHPALSPLRAQFRSLILSNPNHFGNLKDSTFTPVTVLNSNTEFEELTCVGFNSQFNRLEAVVAIKQAFGYGGDLCSSGTPEFVRFFADWNNNGTWTHLGLASFSAYDITPGHPLEYAVTLQLNPNKKWCFFQNLPKVRAVLSWNIPPSLDPNTPPVWGNVLDTHIQISGIQIFLLGTLLEEAKLKLPSEFESVIDLEQSLPVATPKKLSGVELQSIYKEANVPPHRSGFADIQKFIATPTLADVSTLEKFSKVSSLSADILKLLAETNGNTSYEELTCVGLDINQDTLVGVVKVKLANGYSGAPCSAGSSENVAFWIDWNDGNGWTYEGTSSVNVHDYSSLPAGGLSYAVRLPINVNAHMQSCSQGAKIVKVRAILSWETQPTNPNYVPTWGNRQEVTVQIKPGDAVPPGVHIPFLSSVSDTPEHLIGSNGLASNGATTQTGLVLVNSPFGGQVNMAGSIAYPLSGLRYRVMKKLNGAPDSTYVPLISEPQGLQLTLNTFTTGPGWSQSSITLHDSPSGSGYYSYEDYAWYHSIEDHLLGKWETTATDDGQLFDLRIDVSVDGNPDHDLHSNVVTILIDNTVPVADVQLTGFSQSGGPVQPANECGIFHVGDVLHGTYNAYDLHFNDFSLYVIANGPINPSSGSYPTLLTGASGEWTLDTSNMKPCGYNIQLAVVDRTNVNNGGTYWYTYSKTIGFCLEAVQP